jgi:GNAT superfamily N-acetyltransferase
MIHPSSFILFEDLPMPAAQISVRSPIDRTPRVQQIESLFDLPAAAESSLTWSVNIPADILTPDPSTPDPWNLGLIVGPSGSGKTTIANHLFHKTLTPDPSPLAPVIDTFPPDMSITTIVELLSSVGFSSPPAWLRPFQVLSTGEQFRVSLARLLAFAPALAVMDEYTSVVDRTVARIGSAALAKTVRKLNRKFVAVTCHEDVEDWLQPDWTYRPATDTFARRFLQRRPEITLTIYRCRLEAWRLFRPHHYLSSSLHPGAQAFMATWQDRPVAFSAWLPALLKRKSPTTLHAKREHRTVTLPDFQGVGIGMALSDFCASLYSALGHRALSTTTHPAFINARQSSPNWRMTRPPGLAHSSGTGRFRVKHACTRLTAGFEYIGPHLDRKTAARLLG